MNFWQGLKKPIFILAPMEDVTDTVFRRIILSCGRPDAFFTEFTNVDGMFSKGQGIVMQRLKFEPEEKPIIAQIWGLKPENFYKAAKELMEMGFDGVDINMGCPEKSVICKGACSALINDHTLAKEIILATLEGAGTLPVSIKTRLGFKKMQIEEWFGFLLEFNLAAITVHGRTAAERSKVPAHWDEIGEIVKMRDSAGFNRSKISTLPFKEGDKPDELQKTLIIGNGDVSSLIEAKEKALKYNLDGIMIGRGIFHNPWLFNQNKSLRGVTINERLSLLLEHVELFEKTWGSQKNYHILKKYFKIYISDFPGAQEMRVKFMETNNYKDAKELTDIIIV